MISRRVLFTAGALGMVGLESVGLGDEGTPMADQLPANARVPKMRFVYECDAALTEAQVFGSTAEGVRRIIPITGGTFHGPQMKGKVLGGSYDWNLARTDGGHSVEAAYFLQTDDGIMIRVVNRGVGGQSPIESDTGERFYMFTNPVFEAPVGRYDWMNRAIFIATLGARRGTKDAVFIRVFAVI